MKKKSPKKKTTESSGPQKIGDVLTNLLAQRGYAQIASQAALQQGWSKVVENLDKFSRVVEVKRGTLHVIVTNSVVMQELTFRKQDLVQAMSEALPDHKIKQIRFRVGSIR